jgi:hypothetical protein
VNPLGGAIALGHPLGATGAVRTASIVHGMRRPRAEYGMVTMCRGSGLGAGGEIQLTDAISALLREEPVLAYRFQGTRFDCGTHIGLIEATIRYALDHETLSDATRETMQRVLGEMGVVDLD